MNSNAANELNAYPKYKAAYIRAFDKMIIQRAKRGLSCKAHISWNSGEDVLDWWVNGSNNDTQIAGQVMMEELE